MSQLAHLRWPALCARQVIASGGVLAYPTDTVWGLGCDPFNSDAVHRILDIKQRPEEKGLILVVSSLSQLGSFCHGLPPAVLARIQSPQERPTTWLVPDSNDLVPRWIKGRFESVAVRVSRYPAIVALCEALRAPLVSTSANPAGHEPARTRLQLRQYFGSSLDMVFPGNVHALAQPSIIIDAVNGQILRQ